MIIIRENQKTKPENDLQIRQPQEEAVQENMGLSI